MSLFRKKPVVIEAVQWDGTLAGVEAIQESFPRMDTASITYHRGNGTVQAWSISTLEGQHEVTSGDWIIKGVRGEFYPCKPDIFAMTYEEVKP